MLQFHVHIPRLGGSIGHLVKWLDALIWMANWWLTQVTSWIFTWPLKDITCLSANEWHSAKCQSWKLEIWYTSQGCYLDEWPVCAFRQVDICTWANDCQSPGKVPTQIYKIVCTLIVEAFTWLSAWASHSSKLYPGLLNVRESSCH